MEYDETPQVAIRRAGRVTACIVVMALGAKTLDAQPRESNPNAPESLVVAATVDGVPVYVSEVEREIQRIFKDRAIDPDALPLVKAQTLAQLIDRQLVVAWLAKTKKGVTDQELELAVSRLSKQLAQREVTLPQYLQRLDLTETELRREMRWRLGWRRYLDRYLTDKNLGRYFERHRRQLDGTQVRVAHILLKVEPDAFDEAMDRIKRLRQQIDRGVVSFAEAAKMHSAAPTGKNGGNIGFIYRDKPMPEPFSRAAFGLEVNQISEPVNTTFGVHLIQCLEIKPGQKKWREVRDQVEKSATEFLFQWAANQGRPAATIQFTGKTPHLKPGTQTLAD